MNAFTHFFTINNSFNGEQEVLITLCETEEKISSFFRIYHPIDLILTRLQRSDLKSTGEVVPIGTFLQDL